MSIWDSIKSAGDAAVSYAPYVAPIIERHRQRDLQAMMLKQQQDEQAKKDALAQVASGRADRGMDSTVNLQGAQADALRAPKPLPRDPVADANAKWDYEVRNPKPTAPGQPEPMEVTVDASGRRVYTPRSKAAGMRAPEPPVLPSFSAVTLGGENGSPGVVVPFNTRTGEPGDPIGNAKAAAGGIGMAGIKKAIAANTEQLSVLDDAVKELNAHPDAVGLKRGIPIIGDALNQRVDPGGVAARAQISNIGSMIIHDRSGAAVTVHEMPRLAPFVPTASDTPEAIRIKLKKLKAAIEVETGALQTAPPPVGGGRAGGAGGPSKGDINLGAPVSEADWAAKNPPKTGEAFEAYHARYLASQKGAP